jgi:hypothetical protein
LATFLEESVGHTSYVDDMWKSTTIKVKNPLYKRLLFIQTQLKVDRRCLVFWADTLKAPLNGRTGYMI